MLMQSRLARIGRHYLLAAFKITYIGLVVADKPHAAMIATIPLIIPAATKGPRKG